MAKTKAELMAEKMKRQRVGQAAFETGSKPIPQIPDPAEVAPQISSDTSLSNYAERSQTQGRKGKKTPRMNLAIPEDVYSYIRRESRKNGMTYSEFICAVMRQRQNNNN